MQCDDTRVYASIDHAVLLVLVRDRIDDRRALDLVGQYSTERWTKTVSHDQRFTADVVRIPGEG
jgi:hypothetical protein